MSSPYEAILLRDPAPMLDAVLHRWGGDRDLWVFGYASLIWRPAFEADEQRPAVVHGWHRGLTMRSRINRGTPERPGLVFALVSGGSCRGLVYRIGRQRARAELDRLWDREMPTGVYDPRFLPCRTPHGTVQALGFTLSRRSPAHCGRLCDDEMTEVLRGATGRFGSTLDYLLQTHDSLRRCGIRDREIERLVALADRLGLAGDAYARRSAADAPSCALRTSARSASVSTSISTPASSTSTPNAG